MPPLSLRGFAVALTVACGAPVGAQTTQAAPVIAQELRPTGSVFLQVEDLHRAGKYEESLALLEPLLTSPTDGYMAAVHASREALALGYAAQRGDSAKAWLRQAIDYGRLAIAFDSLGVDGRYVTLAAKGRLALISGKTERAHLGAEVERDGLALLAMDSLHAGAHNAVGRFYLEVAKLSWAERLIAKALVGGDVIGRASWEAAESHLQKAAELDPSRNFHLLDLGYLLFSRDRFDEARAVLERSLDVPLNTPAEAGFRAEARAILLEIEKRTSH